MKRRTFLYFSLLGILLFFCLCLPLPAQQPGLQKTQIAILDFEGRGISQGEAGTLTDRFRSELVNTEAFIVLERGRMQEILTEIGLQLSGCTTLDCAVQVGKILNVQKMVAGSIGKIGRTFTVDISYIDVETSRIERSFKRDYRGEIDGLLQTLEKIALEMAGEVRAKLARRGSKLLIQSRPSQAAIILDGKNMGKTPNTLTEIEPGIHTIEILKNNYVPHKETIQLSPGEMKEFTITLKRLYTLHIKSKPRGARVTINNHPVGKTPLTQKLVEGMVLKISITHKGYKDWERTIKLVKDVELIAEMESLVLAEAQKPSSKTWLWIIGGGAVLGGAAALILASQAGEGPGGGKPPGGTPQNLPDPGDIWPPQ